MISVMHKWKKYNFDLHNFLSYISKLQDKITDTSSVCDKSQADIWQSVTGRPGR